MDVTVLAVASRAVIESLERLGMSTEDLLAEVGLPSHWRGEPDDRLSSQTADAIWYAAYARTSDPALALHAAEALSPGAYRVFHYVSRNSPTVGEAFTQVAESFAVIDGRVQMRIVEQESEVHLEMHLGQGGPVPRPPAEYTLAALLLQTRGSTGVDFPVIGADFSFGAPDDAAEHRRVFETVRYGCEATALRFTSKTWNSRIPGADPVLGAMLQQHLAAVHQAVPDAPTLRSQLVELIAQQLPPLPTQESCAKRLGMSGRTLQRRLSEEGTTFRAELDAVRTERAKALLLDPQVSLAEMSWLLGFANQSAFTRAFVRWVGEPPRRYQLSIGVKR